MLLSDLTFIDEGNPNKLENDFIHFKKHKLTALVIKQIGQYQQSPFCFEPVAVIKEFIQNMTPMDEQELFKLSLAAEPRQLSASTSTTGTP